MTRGKARPQEESDEESESEESDETDELEDAEEEGMDSDVDIVVPKEEEEDSSDVEIVEAPQASKKILAPRKNPSKRVRPASSDEEDDSDNGTPPAAPPKSTRKQDKESGKAVSSREIKNLGTRLKSVSPLFFYSRTRKSSSLFPLLFCPSCSARSQTNQSTSLLNTLPERWRKTKRGDQIGLPFRKTRRI